MSAAASSTHRLEPSPCPSAGPLRQDEVIESFEARYAEARAELGQLRGQLEAAQQAAGTSGVRVRELVEANNHLRREAEHAAATAAEAEAELRGDAARLQGEVGAAAARLQTEAAAAAALRQEAGRLQQQLEDARAELAATQRQQQTLYATVDAANEAIEVCWRSLDMCISAVGRCRCALQQVRRPLLWFWPIQCVHVLMPTW